MWRREEDLMLKIVHLRYFHNRWQSNLWSFHSSDWITLCSINHEAGRAHAHRLAYIHFKSRAPLRLHLITIHRNYAEWPIKGLQNLRAFVIRWGIRRLSIRQGVHLRGKRKGLEKREQRIQATEAKTWQDKAALSRWERLTAKNDAIFPPTKHKTWHTRTSAWLWYWMRQLL